jgi:AraC-like DNA-binding protein
VFALVAGRAEQARIAAAMPKTGQLTFAASAQELRDAAYQARADVIIVEPQCPAGLETGPLIRQIRDAFPDLPVLAYCDPQRVGSGQIVEIVRAGATEILLRGFDDVRFVLTRAIEQARRQCIVDRIYERVAGQLPPDARPIVAYFLQHGATGPSVADAAAALGVHRKTLVNRMTAAHLPPPRVISSWCRLLTAAHLLETSRKSANRVALELSFPSGTALRNMLQRYVGLTPSELRTRRCVETVAELFVRAMSGRVP